MIYGVVLVSAVEQSDRLDMILFPYRSLQSIEKSLLQVFIICFHLVIVYFSSKLWIWGYVHYP